MTKADEELREHIKDLFQEYSGVWLANKSAEDELDRKLDQLITAERKKAVQQFAAEVKWKLKLAEPEGWTVSKSVAAIDEALGEVQ